MSSSRLKNMGIRDKLDYGTVLFEMILQTARQGHDVRAYYTNVNMIADTLMPYWDDDYNKSIKELEDEVEAFKNGNFDKFGKAMLPSQRQIAERKYRILMDLARRKALLPTENITHIMGDAI